MAYTIQDIHNRILFLIDKERNGFITHEEIDQAIDIAQMRRLDFLYGNPVQYQPGAPIPQSSLGITQYVNDALSPFIKRLALSSGNTTSGAITMPSDYLRGISVKTNVYNNALATTLTYDVEPITEEELAGRLKSQIIAPSTTEPVYVQRAGVLQVYPQSTFTGELIYLKRPVKPVFAYTQSGRAISYNSGGSTQLEWRDDQTEHIINLTVEILGFNLNDQVTQQYGQKQSKDA
jgi:hypothetical protein